MELPKFCPSEKHFKEIHHNLKLIYCPHCRKTQNLILHGYLYGFGYKTYSQRITRGHRILCSNRNRRDGCGKTFSIFFKVFLKNFIINTKSLWQVLKNHSSGKNKTRSFQSLDLPFCPTTCYRLFKKFHLKQHHIRSYLSRRCKAPKDTNENITPKIATLRHCQKTFPREDPIAAFQQYFQVSFL